MKTLFVCFILTVTYCLAELTAEQKAKLEPIAKECRDIFGITGEDTKSIKEKRIVPDDDKVRKHMACMLKKSGIMTDSGEISKEKVEAIMKRVGASDDTKTKICACITKKDTPEETAAIFMNCAWKIQRDFSPAD